VSAHTVTGTHGTAAVIGNGTAGGIEETRGTVGADGPKEAEGPGAEARIEIDRTDAEVDRTAGTPAHAHAPATVPRDRDRSRDRKSSRGRRERRSEDRDLKDPLRSWTETAVPTRISATGKSTTPRSSAWKFPKIPRRNRNATR
jgi:hypothetical protein